MTKELEDQILYLKEIINKILVATGPVTVPLRTHREHDVMINVEPDEENNQVTFSVTDVFTDGG